ncbi:ammonia channel protein, partial [Streptomyces sp. SID8455]|nr:ammonia channel protein [Streptomyces sp. SID8455]
LVVSGLIALVLHKTIGMRVSEDEEISGIDQIEHAETAYDFSGAGGGTVSRTPAQDTTAAPKAKKVDA